MEDKDKLIEKISQWFFSDAVILLDDVLGDDLEDPQFSANTAFNRLKTVFSFNKIFYNQIEETDVFEWMLESGYTKEDVALFKWKIEDEQNRYKDWWGK